MSSVRRLIAAAIGALVCCPPALASIIDIRSAGIGDPQAGHNGAVLTVTDAMSAGTGTITSFLRVHAAGNETTQKGYNVGFPRNSFPPGFPDFQQVAGNFTFKIQLGTIPHVGGASPGGYRRFLLDVNEPGGSAADISIERLMIFVGNVNPNTLIGAGGDPGQLGDPSPAFGDRVYDMGIDGMGVLNTVLMSDRFPGSGAFDLAIDIPEVNFTGHDADEFLTLFVDFGGFAGGFEEFAVRGTGGGAGPGGSGGPIDPPPIPEPSTLTLAGIGVLGLLVYRRTRARLRQGLSQ